MAEKRLGRQTPTKSVTLPYTETKGQEAIDLYNKTGRIAQEWQEILVYDIMATNEEGLWTHPRFGYSVPRRNGKNEVVVMREMHGLVNGEHICHTAHRTSTSHAAWERIKMLLSKAGYVETEDFKTLKQMGLEKIEWLREPFGTLQFRTRSAHGGLGEGFDLLIIDEAQEYTDDQESALQYTVSDSKNPQMIFCGTPPTTVSLGTTFEKMREDVLSGDPSEEETGWAEWSVDTMKAYDDVEAWYETNPSLGTILTERKIKNEKKKDELDYNIQRLGYWSKENLKSAISEGEWKELAVKKVPKFAKSIYAGIKYGVDGTNVAMSVAVRTTDGKVFVEAIDCKPIRNGNGWIIDYLKAMKCTKVVIDGQNGQTVLEDEMKAAKIKNALLPTVKDVITANAMFENKLAEKSICHMDQGSLTRVVSNCQHRKIGSNGGYGFESILEGAEIALMDSMILAHWACITTKEKRKQKVTW